MSRCEFAEPADIESLRGLAGVSDLEASDGRVRFKLAGEIDPVLKAIAAHTVLDLEVAHPTLEEVFLTYYQAEPSDREQSRVTEGETE